MSDPMFRTQRNKRTGETRELISEDGGNTWHQVMSQGDPGAPPPFGEDPPGFDGGANTGATSPPQDHGLLDRPMTLRGMGQGAMDFAKQAGTTALDAATGISQGISGGNADELMGMLPWNSQEEQAAVARAARERSPMAYDAGDAAGGAALAFASPASRAAGPLARTALAAAEGGTVAAGRTDGSMQDRVLAFLAGGGMGGALPAAGETFGALGRKVGPSVARMAGDMADGLRGRAFSAPDKLAQLSRERGLDYTEHELGKQAERLGLANKFLPQSARQYADRSGVAREQIGGRIGDALDEASAQNAHGYAENIMDGLQQIRRGGALDRSSLGSPREAAAQEILDRMRPEAGMMSPRQLHTLKREYEAGGGYVPDHIKKTPEGVKQVVNQEAADLARKELNSSMKLALPDTREAFETSNRDYQFAATINNLARDRAVQNSRHSVGLSTVGMTGLGGAVGNLPGAAMGYGASRLARSYGQDAGANGMRALQWMAEGAGQGMPTPSISPQAGGRQAQQAIEQHAAQKASDEGRGYRMESAVVQVLNSRPEMLGPYRQRLQEAQQSGDSMRMAGVLSDLNADPQFRSTVGRQLLQMTAKGGAQ